MLPVPQYCFMNPQFNIKYFGANGVSGQPKKALWEEGLALNNNEVFN